MSAPATSAVADRCWRSQQNRAQPRVRGAAPAREHCRPLREHPFHRNRRLLGIDARLDAAAWLSARSLAIRPAAMSSSAAINGTVNPTTEIRASDERAIFRFRSVRW